MRIITVPVTDIRERIRSILATLDAPVFVTQRGRVKAVLLGIDAYNDLLDDLDDARLASDPEFLTSLAEAKTGRTVPFEVVLKENGLPA